jgi:hypothetical protein
MADELARWAATRAGDLIARAEAEAVAELKAALLRAASSSATRSDPGAPSPAPRAAGGTLLWVYCVLRASEETPDGLPGVSGPVERIEHQGLAALVSRVPEAEYGEAVLPGSLNDLDWLARVSRTHESILERAGEQAAIVPLRLCTIFVDEARVRQMLAERREAFDAALERLDGCQEWTVKLLFDAERVATSAEDDVSPDEPGTGTAYLLKRRADRDRRAAAEQLGRELAEDVHARLQDWAIDAVVRPPQNRELSGHEGDMLLNGAYLVEAARANELRVLVAELQDQHRAAGARLELAGPLPPFNFVVPPDGDTLP